MDISKIEVNSEEVASGVHDAWCDEKKKQGFHPPYECKSKEASVAHTQYMKSYGYYEFPKFHKFCDKCHPDMYPYEQLPENIKDYYRVTVSAVLKAISRI